LLALENARLESTANLSIEQKRFNAEQIEDNLQRLNKQKEIDAEEQEMQSNRLQAIIDEAANGTQAKIDAQIALDEFMEQSRQTNFERKKEIEDEEARIEKENSDSKVAVAKAEADAKDKIFAQTEKALGQLSGIAGEETKAGKAFAVAAATINTYRGVSDALAATTVTPFETALKFINAASILSNGLKNVKSILAVKIPQTSVGGRMSGGGGVGGGGAAPQAPSFNIVGSDPQNQLAQTLATQTDKPVKAFVVSGDVTTAQSLDRNIIQESSLG